MSRYGFTTKTAGVTIASAHMNAVQTGVEAAVSGTAYYFTSGGAANAYTGALTPAVDAYANARLVLMTANHTNTGAATLNLDSVGATAIKKTDGATDVAAGDLVSGQTYLLSYNGTSWCLVGGGSAAAGGGFWERIIIPAVRHDGVVNLTQTNGTWVSSSDSAFYMQGVAAYNSSNASGNLVTKENVNVPATGDYSMSVVHSTGANQGIMGLYKDGVQLTTVDTYAASGERNRWATISLGTCTAGTEFTVGIKSEGKNASSTDYYVDFSEIHIYRTA